MPSQVVVGIDVGGPNKGFHALAMRGGAFLEKRASKDPMSITDWCQGIGAEVIAIDAPCKWRGIEGPPRMAEIQMAAAGISCYYTPTESRARQRSFYTWMIAGQELFQTLNPGYRLYDGSRQVDGVVLETFPHAVACALSGSVVSAKRKRTLRLALLSRTDFPVVNLRNIDEIDASLCALAALAFRSGHFMEFGDSSSGFIIVPAVPSSVTPNGLV